jgi:hypothetical protein
VAARTRASAGGGLPARGEHRRQTGRNGHDGKRNQTLHGFNSCFENWLKCAPANIARRTNEKRKSEPEQNGSYFSHLQNSTEADGRSGKSNFATWSATQRGDGAGKAMRSATIATGTVSETSEAASCRSSLFTGAGTTAQQQPI